MSVEFERKYWTNDGVPTEEIPVPAVLSAENMNRIEEGISGAHLNLKEHINTPARVYQLTTTTTNFENGWGSEGKTEISNYNEGGFHIKRSSTGNLLIPYRIVVPDGVKLVKATLSAYDSGSTGFELYITKEGYGNVATAVENAQSSAFSVSCCTSALIGVSKGDLLTVDIRTKDKSKTIDKVSLIIEEIPVSGN